jgi:hypothetical protein
VTLAARHKITQRKNPLRASGRASADGDISATKRPPTRWSVPTGSPETVDTCSPSGSEWAVTTREGTAGLLSGTATTRTLGAAGTTGLNGNAYSVADRVVPGSSDSDTTWLVAPDQFGGPKTALARTTSGWLSKAARAVNDSGKGLLTRTRRGARIGMTRNGRMPAAAARAAKEDALPSSSRRLQVRPLTPVI